MTEDAKESGNGPHTSRSSGANRASAIAAGAATFTAIVAVVIALWDNVQTRKHNRLTVQPYIVIQRVQHDSSGIGRGEIMLSNEGVGPAILRGLEIRLQLEDGRDTVMTSWGTAAPLIQRRGLLIRGWMEIDSGSALGVQRNGLLLRVQSEGDSASTRIQNLFDALQVRLRYGSVYGDPAEASLDARGR